MFEPKCEIFKQRILESISCVKFQHFNETKTHELLVFFSKLLHYDIISLNGKLWSFTKSPLLLGEKLNKLIFEDYKTIDKFCLDLKQLDKKLIFVDKSEKFDDLLANILNFMKFKVNFIQCFHNLKTFFFKFSQEQVFYQIYGQNYLEPIKLIMKLPNPLRLFHNSIRGKLTEFQHHLELNELNITILRKKKRY